MKKYISLFIIFIFFSGYSFAQICQQNKSHKDKHNSSTSNLKLFAENSRSDTIDILKYTINLNITDFTSKIIYGSAEIKFNPKINGVNTIYLDFLKLTIDSIEINNTNLTYEYNDTLLKVNLPLTYTVIDTVNLLVYYKGTPQGDPSGWGGFYFENGFAYNLGVGFGANPHTYGRAWFPCFDNFIERSSYEFNITTNNGKIAYCNGYLANDTSDNNGNRTRKWILQETIPSYLASVAVANYTQVNQVYNGINGPLPITLVALASDTTHTKNSFINLNTALSTFENRFGPYLWNRVGFCMVPFNSGAMEHATNISYPKFAADGTLNYQSLYAHELSHHWFGDLATCRTQEDMWLNEGWARYCEFIFTETLSGYDSYLKEVRTNHESNLHFNHVNDGGYLSLNNIPFDFTYGDHVYNKGADVAHTLRGYMGDSLFFHSIKYYLSQNNYKDVSSNDFRDALSVASGINLTNFFNDWVFNPGWTHFSIDSFIVIPNGLNFDVSIYVKQKLTEAPNYYTNVPLELTFKSADWVEQSQTIVMSGASALFNFTIPFHPSFVAINMTEKISHAIAPEYKKIKNIGNFNFINAKMNMTVQAITDSAFVRIEHNYTAPDGFKSFNHPYRLSPNHYWKVDGILPNTFKAKATINYDGRTSSATVNQWLDNELINTMEDSLVLMYRKHVANEWEVYPYYTKNMLGSNNDKRGLITIDSITLGEYTFAIKDYSAAVQNSKNIDKLVELKVFPNPTKDILTIDLAASSIKVSNNYSLEITDATGKLIYKEKLFLMQNVVNINTSSFSDGIYYITVMGNNMLMAKKKFIVLK